MAEKNVTFTKQIKKAFAEKKISFEPGKRGGLSDFVTEHGFVYSTLNKALTQEGHVPTWDILIRLSEIFEHPIEWFLKGDEGHIPPKDNVVFIPRKYPEFYELLEEVIQSDRADEAISACDTYLRGIMMKESRVIQKLDEIAELLRQLLEPETGPGKRRKGPALGNR
jgi:hypothetical protein